MSYEWGNCLRTELRTTLLLQINCKSYDLKLRIIIKSTKFNVYLFSITGDAYRYDILYYIIYL
jgi:hypothetical protein